MNYLLQATWETLYMVVISGVLSLSAGLAIGVWLYLSGKNRPLQNPTWYATVSTIVNLTRSIPFIILMVAILPFTRFIIGTTIGTNAAIVPLTLCAIPFFARICQSALEDLPSTLLETSNALGATTWQCVYKFLLPESAPTLIRGATLTIIGLIGYSAMAGAVGGGGLGQLAIDYGYQQFNIKVMLETVVVLVLIVQVVQYLGDFCASRRLVKPLLIGTLITLLVILAGQAYSHDTVANTTNTLRVGIISGPQEKIMAIAQKEALKKYGLNLKLVKFDDYILPNTALNDGDIDANIFQHVPYLNAQIKARGYQLTPIAKTFVYPMGFYSQKIHSIRGLKSGDLVAIPSDPSNQARALLLLQHAGLITLKKGVGTNATLHDIEQNPLQLKFKALPAATLPRVMQDATLVGLTNDFVGAAGLSLKQAILREGPQSPYANVIVVRKGTQTNPQFKNLVNVMHSKAVLNETKKLFPNGAAIPAWTRTP